MSCGLCVLIVEFRRLIANLWSLYGYSKDGGMDKLRFERVVSAG